MDAAAAVHDVLLLIIIFYYLQTFYNIYLITGDRHRTAPGPSVHRHIHRDWHLVDVYIFPRFVHHETGRLPLGRTYRRVQRRYL